MTETTTGTPVATDLWCRLPADILQSIAKRLNYKADAASSSSSPNHTNAIGLLRSVCKSWRSSIEKPPSSSLLLPLPFPIVPNPNLNPNSCRGGYFSLTQSTLYFLLQPPPPSSSSSSSVLYGTTTNTAGCCWLLRVQEPPSQNNNRCKIYHPINPLSKLGAERVPKAAFPESLNLLDVGIVEIGRAYCLKFVDGRKKKQDCPKFKRRTMEEVQADYQLTYPTSIKKVAVSPEDFGIIAINSGRLCFFKLDGDQKWILVDSSNNRYHDIVYRKGKYCAVDYGGRTVVIDGVDLKKVKVTASPLRGLGACQFTRLVESGDDLFLVYRFLAPGHEAGISIGAVTMGMVTEESHPGMPNYFNVYKLDEENKQWQRVDDLNHQVFFLGDDYSFSVFAQDFPGLKGNCIYFSDCKFRARNEKEANIGKSCVLTGVYNMKDRSCGPLAFFRDHWPIFSPPPAWLKLKHREGMMEGMNEDQLQRDATALKQDMPEPTPEAKKIAAEAKFRGNDAYIRKDYLVALDAYTQAIGFDPSDAILFSNRSVCWIRLGQAGHALTDAKACRALRPDWPKACYREGAALQLLRRFDEAADSFREGVELDPNNKDLANAFREAVEAGKKFRGTNQ